MPEAVLTPSSAELHLDHLSVAPGRITVVAHAKRSFACCPACLEPSRRVHSRYLRHLADLPWHGIPVHIELHTRRFLCDTPGCPRRIFTERLSETTCCRARRTSRLLSAHRLIALALGGEAGARLAEELGLVVSADTLLRRLKAGCTDSHEAPAPLTPRCLGVDDWAWRKGQRYGTLLCDLERGHIVDLLPVRSAESLAEWLRRHPGIDVISRDRSGIYAEGAATGAPGAVQVADRFHLFKNLTDALQRILERQHGQLRRAMVNASQEAEQEALAALQAQPTAEPKEQRPSAAARQKQERRARRLACYTEVVKLKKIGLSHGAIARKVGIERRTVIRCLQHGSFPERRDRPRRQHLLDPYLEYIRQRWEEGVTNASQLFREIRERGYRGTSYSQLRDLVQGWRVGPYPTKRFGPPPLASVRQSAWLLALPEEKRTPDQQRYLDSVAEVWPEVRELERLAREFVRFFREKDASTIGLWIHAAERTPLRSFARGLFSDLRAIRAAIELPWSTGPTEGHINRLKTLKRQMYGRAGFELLRARVLAA